MKDHMSDPVTDHLDDEVLEAVSLELSIDASRYTMGELRTLLNREAEEAMDSIFTEYEREEDPYGRERQERYRIVTWANQMITESLFEDQEPDHEPEQQKDRPEDHA